MSGMKEIRRQIPGLDEIIFCYPGLHAITVYRLAHIIHTAGGPTIPRMMTELAHSRTGVDIHPGAAIGGNVWITKSVAPGTRVTL